MAAKPISEKIQKRVKKGRKAVERGAKAAEKNVRRRLGSIDASPAKVAGVAAAGMAGAAGIAAAVRYLRRDGKGRARIHVTANGSEWLISADGQDEPLQVFRTKEEAVDAGREAALAAAPSELVIHRLDGSVMRSHSYDPE